MPEFTVHSADGSQVVRLQFNKVPTTIIFSACAPCDEKVLKRWESASNLRGDDIVYVFDTAPSQVSTARKNWRLGGRIFLSRDRALFRSLGIKALPAMAIISRDGMILDVQGGGLENG